MDDLARDASPLAARHHVGLLVPSSNTTVEYEYNRFGPAGIVWHVGRLTLTEVSAQGIAAQEPDIARESAKLGSAHPALLLLCQSAVGFIGGEAHERETVGRMEAASGARGLSAAGLMVAAVRALGARRIGLATPFASAVDAQAAAYFAQVGLQPVRQSSLGLSGNYGIAGVTAGQLVDLVRQADGPEVEAVVLPGGNLQAMALLPEIEAALGKPVVVTNQACIWGVARLLGVALGPGLGRLGERPWARPAIFSDKIDPTPQ